MNYEIGKSYPMPKFKAPLELQDVIPNGEDFRSREYTALIQRRKPLKVRMDAHYWRRISLTVECSRCKAPVGQACTSTARGRVGEPLNSPHGERLAAVARKKK